MPRKVPLIDICAAPNCGQQIIEARGLCHRHYQRFKRHGVVDEIDRRLGPAVAEGNKYCAQCRLEKPLGAFRRTACYCKSCEAIYYHDRKVAKRARGECYSCGRKALAGITICGTCRQWGAQYRSNFVNRARSLLNSAQRRAKEQGVVFDLDMDWVMIRIVGRCQLTDIPFDLEGKRSYVRQRYNPYAPSIDRRNAGGNYSKDNCRMILIAINVGINHWGEEVYRSIARAYLHQRREKRKSGREDNSLKNYDLPLDGQNPQSVRIRKH
jgi:hypothetical protein